MNFPTSTAQTRIDLTANDQPLCENLAGLEFSPNKLIQKTYCYLREPKRGSPCSSFTRFRFAVPIPRLHFVPPHDLRRDSKRTRKGLAFRPTRLSTSPPPPAMPQFAHGFLKPPLPIIFFRSALRTQSSTPGIASIRATPPPPRTT